jgi:hypothetical protein
MRRRRVDDASQRRGRFRVLVGSSTTPTIGRPWQTTHDAAATANDGERRVARAAARPVATVAAAGVGQRRDAPADPARVRPPSGRRPVGAAIGRRTTGAPAEQVVLSVDELAAPARAAGLVTIGSTAAATGATSVRRAAVGSGPTRSTSATRRRASEAVVAATRPKGPAGEAPPSAPSANVPTGRRRARAPAGPVPRHRHGGGASAGRPTCSRSSASSPAGTPVGPWTP